MKTFKSLRVSAMTRVYEVGTQPYLVVTSLLYFPLERPDVLLSEQSLWRGTSEEMPPAGAPLDGGSINTAAAILDEGLPKPCGEVVVRAFAFPSGGPQPGCAVRVQIGAPEAPLVDKSLSVSGDRVWEFLGMTQPQPFEKIALSWENAFGGTGFAANPVGKGFAPVKGENGEAVHPLPNVELPSQRVKAKGDRPNPGSFAALDASWQMRTSKMGTFDQRWLETEYPGLPSDMQLAAFSTAPEDQRIEGFFAGGEPVVLENMHPTQPRIESRIPTFKVRVFITPRGGGVEKLRDLSTRIDTVILFPHLSRGVVVHRAVAEIEEDDAHDIDHLMVAVENADEPRDRAYYERAFATRLDPEGNGFVSIQDVDLLPKLPKWTGADPDHEEMYAYIKRDDLLQKNFGRRSVRDHEKVMAEIRAAGLDPKDLGVPLVAPGASFVEDAPEEDEEEDPEAEAREMKAHERDLAEAQERRVEAEKRAREVCKENGFDFDELMKHGEGGGPPKFSAAAELAKIRQGVAEAREVGVELPELEKQANDPVFEEQLHQREKQMNDGYRAGAHFMPAARRPDAELAEQLRDRVVAVAGAEPLFEDVDLTGADLHGVELPGADLSGAFLERANLVGADLRGANLRRAVLARADLTGANLCGADLRGANLGEADLTDADLEGADLEGAILFRARVERTRLERARLISVDMWEVAIKDAFFDGATIEKTTFIQSKIDGFRAAKCTLREVVFIQCEVHGIVLDGATADQLAFVTSRGERASFRGASLLQARFVADCVFPKADFRKAAVLGGCFRGTELEGASFEGADLSGSDLSEVHAAGASFRRANLTSAMLVRADLREADFTEAKLLDAVAHKARLGGARFDGANVFQADLAGTKGDDRTSFAGANVGRVRYTRRSTV